MKRIVLGFLAVMVIAVAMAMIFIHTDYGRDVVRAKVQAQLEDTFTGGATIGKIEGSPFGELVIRDLVINGPDGKPAITIGRARFELGLTGLVSQRAKITGLHAQDVEVDLRRDADGSLQIARLMKPGPKSQWVVDLTSLAIERAHVAIAMADGTTQHLDDIAIKGSAQLHPDTTDATIALTGTWRDRKAPIALDAKVRQTPELVELATLSLHVGEVFVDGTHVTIHPGDPAPQFGGSLVVRAPRDGVKALVPSVDLPGNVALDLTLAPVGDRPGTTHVELGGTMGVDSVIANVDVDLANLRGTGMVTTSEVDLAALTGGKVAARGGAFVMFDLVSPEAGKLPVGTAVVHARGVYEDFPRTVVTAALTSDGVHVASTIGASNAALATTITADLTKIGDAITLERSHIVASSGDPATASAGKAPVHGSFDVDLNASGALLPNPALVVAGHVNGKNLRAADVRVATLALKIDASGLPANPRGKADLAMTGVARGDLYLRQLAVTAANRADGAFDVTLRSRPRQDPTVVEADAVVRLGDVITIDLKRHLVKLGNGNDWTGTSGRVVIAPQRIEIHDFKSAGKDGALAAEATLNRRTGDVVAKIDAGGVKLSVIDPTFAGLVGAHVNVERRGGKLAGTATIEARGVILAPNQGAIDADASINATGGTVAVHANATALGVGKAKLDVEVTAPADMTDVAAWKRSGRDSIKTGRLVLEGIDIAKAAKLAGIEGEYSGRIDGDVQVSAATTGGVIQVRELMAPSLRGVGGVNADLRFSATADEIIPTFSARVGALGTITGEARLALPPRVFDPASWRMLGKKAVRQASLRVEEIELDPGQLDRLGITTYARGRVSLAAEISEAMEGAKVRVTVRSLRGSPISQPVDVDVLATIDGAGTKAEITATTRELKATKPVGPVVKLLTVTGTIPLTMAEVQADPSAVLAKPLAFEAVVPNIPAKQLLAVFGRSEISGGTIAGNIKVAGTVGNPTGTAHLVGTNIQVPPGAGGKPVKTVKRIAIDASWDGTSGKLLVDSTQDNGMLHIAAAGSPLALDKVTVQLEAKQFDLLPLLAFAPGPAGGAAGRLDAKVNMIGIDPKTAKVTGEVHLSHARIPIAPEVGTLRRAKIDIVVKGHDLVVTADGRLGGGTVKANGTIAMDGASPTGGNLKLVLRKVAPIGSVEPKIDADVDVKMRREAERWIADMTVTNGTVIVPKDRGEPLDPVGAPTDMVFMTGERITKGPMVKAPPVRPVIVVNITINRTYIESEELRGIIRGKVTITSDGDSIGLVGNIEADRGDLDLFGRRYQVERAAVRFDGTIDPLLDVRITHDFAEVTTVTQVRGRLSKPQLIMTSNPGSYSQGQLLGFLLGGEPNGAPGDARDRATAAGTSLIANKIGGYFKKALPVNLDVLKYESGTSTSSASVTVGTWLTRSLFLAYRQRLSARPDENSGEGEVEYWFTRRIVVEGVVGDRNYNGVDLLWRKRY
ncbi:MAG: translocation/assembly module TamB domain-containing protein [Kofleriaceae bacterium]